MVYDGSFEYNGEVINYRRSDSRYVVHYKKDKVFEENPYVETFIDLYFENGQILSLPIYTKQNNLTTLKSEFVKKEYIQYLKDQGKL